MLHIPPHDSLRLPTSMDGHEAGSYPRATEIYATLSRLSRLTFRGLFQHFPGRSLQKARIGLVAMTLPAPS